VNSYVYASLRFASVRALTANWFELSTPKWVHAVCDRPSVRADREVKRSKDKVTGSVSLNLAGPTESARRYECTFLPRDAL